MNLPTTFTDHALYYYILVFETFGNPHTFASLA